MNSKVFACIGGALSVVASMVVAFGLPAISDAIGPWLFVLAGLFFGGIVVVLRLVLAHRDVLSADWQERYAGTSPPSLEPPSRGAYFHGPHRPSDDPLAGVGEPKRHRPGGRASSAAVPEPDDDRDFIDATAHRTLTLRR